MTTLFINARRAVAVGMLLVGGLLVTTAAHAQELARVDETGISARAAARTALVESVGNPVATLSSMPKVSDDWIAHVDQQFATSLQSPIAAIREQTLQDVIYIAQFHGDTVTFKKVVSPLLNIYLFDKDDRYRIMAIAALHAVGDAYGMQRLREEVSGVRSRRVRQLTLALLADYDRSRALP